MRTNIIMIISGYVKYFILISCITFIPSSNASELPFYFVFQEVYNSQVTLNRVKMMFNEFPHVVKKPVHYSGSADIKGIHALIEKKELDLLLWGFSKTLDHHMKNKNFEAVAAANIEISLYEYQHGLIREDGEPYKVAVMADSAAHFITKSFFEQTGDQAELVLYKNYFSIMQAMLKKEVHMVAAAPSFLINQPSTIQKNLITERVIPVKSRVSVWVKSELPEKVKSSVLDYFSSKESILSNITGTGEFFDPRYDPI